LVQVLGLRLVFFENATRFFLTIFLRKIGLDGPKSLASPAAVSVNKKRRNNPIWMGRGDEDCDEPTIYQVADARHSPEEAAALLAHV
jgi:hypothetical protein